MGDFTTSMNLYLPDNISSNNSSQSFKDFLKNNNSLSTISSNYQPSILPIYNNCLVEEQSSIPTIGTGVVALAKKHQQSLGKRFSLKGLEKPIKKKQKRQKDVETLLLEDSLSKTNNKSLFDLCLENISTTHLNELYNPNILECNINIVFKYIIQKYYSSITFKELLWFSRSLYLKCLYCKNLYHLKEYEIVEFIKRIAMNNQSSNIKEIIFSKCFQVSDITINALLEYNFYIIDKLDLSGCHKIYGEQLKLYFDKIHCEKLKYLSLKGCTYIDNNDLLYIFSNNIFSSLQSINLSNLKISDNVFEILLRNSPNISSISIGNCSELTIKSLENITKYYTIINRLDISGMKNITEKTIQLLLRYKNHITHLNLFDCIPYVSISLHNLLSQCVFLENINLSSCVLSDTSIQYLAKIPKPLKKLTLINSNISSSCIRLLLKNCGNSLVYLNISGTLIDDTLFYNIQKYCKQLNEIDISFCRNISQNGINYLLKNCKNIKNINMFGIFDINNSNN